MNIITRSESRELSGGKIFRVRDGQNHYAILAQAEKIPGSIVIFEPGSYDFLHPFVYRNIASILGYGPTSTKFGRWGNKLFSCVQDYASNDIVHAWSGFTIENLEYTDEPAIEFGGTSFSTVDNVWSVGKPSDFIHVVNEDPRMTPPEGAAFGCWTENVRLRDLLVYGYLRGIVTICKDPTGGNNSFSNFKASGVQFGATAPGSIGLDIGPHSNFYAASLGMKFNVERSCEGDATCINVGEGCNLQGNFDCYVEGNAERDESGAVIRPAGTRIKVAASARVTGWGRFTRQSYETIRDEIAKPALRWDGLQGGFVESEILEDQ